jgi:putative ABC transport system permease protein
VKIFVYFVVIAIFISCMGLFGLSSFTAEQKTKEIGVRKILGASAVKILYLLSKEFMKWVLLANVIAWPVAYFVMTKWLQNFAYRARPGWWVFGASALAAILIALFTVSYQSIRAATSNPVDSLRYE